MNSHDPIRRRMLTRAPGLVLMGALPLGLAGCVSARLYEHADAPPDGLKVSVGDAWSYREINGYNRERVADVRYTVRGTTPLELEVEVDGKPLSALRSGQIERYAAPWVVAQDTVYDRDNRYEPPLPVLPTVLEPGVRESWQSMVIDDPKDRARRWHVQLDVLGEERVTVPAGEFDALRIRRLIKFEHPDFFRMFSERREELWYAPEIRRWIRREWSGSYQQRMRSRAPLLREDWIVWELQTFTQA
ncbi:DUF3108 domain-containing protein [Methyloversatilis thermotolerans]|uniref:DUF3108 domain-containing protein n=1 Tax=Methyloversatilis thermotolerans TaxID=1346290 RepID=UPI0003698419|nr:DUF3108 domain-containing protein [Methyloversatilis thermotolerans]